MQIKPRLYRKTLRNVLLIRFYIDAPKKTKPHLATPDEMAAFRSGLSTHTPAESMAKMLEFRRRAQEEEALENEALKASTKKP